MARYHIGKNGPELCKADPENPRSTGCPFEKKGDPHFGSLEEASAAYEELNKDKTLSTVPSSRVFAEDQNPEIHTNWKERSQILQNELQGAIGDLDKDENWLNHLNNMSKMRRYSFGNLLLLTMQTGGKADMCAAASVWKQMDRHPKPGEKALYVLGPVFKKVERLGKDGKPIMGEDGKPQKVSKLVYFKTMPTFDISQTEGKPLPDYFRALSEDPPEGYIDDLENAIAKRGYTVHYEEIATVTDDGHVVGREGYTAEERHSMQHGSEKKVVVVDKNLPPGQRASVLAHELGHIYAGHMDNLSDYHTGESGKRGQMETEADSIAYVLSRMNGMAIESKANAQYIHHWSKGNKRALKDSAENVHRAIGNILSENNFGNVQNDPLDEAREKAKAEYASKPKKRRTRKKR